MPDGAATARQQALDALIADIRDRIEDPPPFTSLEIQNAYVFGLQVALDLAMEWAGSE
jgi:hypothetical protein